GRRALALRARRADRQGRRADVSAGPRRRGRGRGPRGRALERGRYPRRHRDVPSGARGARRERHTTPHRGDRRGPAGPGGRMSEDNEFLIGIRLREGMPADDYKFVDLQLHVGDLALVETSGGTAIGEVRRPARPLPDFKRDRLYRRVLRAATDREADEYDDRRDRERQAVQTCQQIAREHG